MGIAMLVSLCCTLAICMGFTTVVADFVMTERMRGGELKRVEVRGEYQDCVELHLAGYKRSGLYRVHPHGLNTSLVVKCVQGVNSSWTIVQERVNGNLDFGQPWVSYRYGFGTATQNFWAGLEYIHSITQFNNKYLQVNLIDWRNINYWAAYTQFYVGDVNDNFRMQVTGYYGNAPDDFSYQSNMPFATMDHPDHYNCVQNMRAGWWYNYCAKSLLNGRYYNNGYYPQPPSGQWDGMYWQDLYGYNYSMKYTAMLVGTPNVHA